MPSTYTNNPGTAWTEVDPDAITTWTNIAA